MKSNRAFVRNPGDGYLQLIFSVTSACGIKRVICKTWTGTLANSADLGQMPQKELE